MARRRYIQAINEALFEEMERDPKVIVFGEDVELAIFGDTRGLHDRFGPNRIRNTPICEATLTGMAVGAAAAGYRVVLHMMFSNFIYTGFDAIANQMAKLRLMTGGQIELPITVIASYGGGRIAGRAAFGHAAPAADEPRGRQRRRAPTPGRCQGAAQDRDPRPQSAPSSSNRAGAAATSAKCPTAITSCRSATRRCCARETT